MFLSLTGADNVQTSASSALVAGTWYHIALCRDTNAVYRLYLDGAMVAEETDFMSSDLFNPPEGSRYFNIGGSYATSQGYLGQIHGVRITHGVDRYGGGAEAPSADVFPAYAPAA